MEQSAVKWLINEWLYLDQQFDMCLIDRNIYWDKLRQIQEQAKEMEKEQMEITWNNAIDALLKDKWDSYDDFHKTTFKSE